MEAPVEVDRCVQLSSERAVDDLRPRGPVPVEVGPLIQGLVHPDGEYVEAPVGIGDGGCTENQATEGLGGPSVVTAGDLPQRAQPISAEDVEVPGRVAYHGFATGECARC